MNVDTALDPFTQDYQDPIAVSFLGDAEQARRAHRPDEVARLLYCAAIIEWGEDDPATGEAYRRAVTAGGVSPDPEMDLLHGWCSAHEAPLCTACMDEWGRVTCHHPDHEDSCVG